LRGAIVKRRIDPALLLAEVSSNANGAAILFVGTVREVNEGRSVTGVEYSAYEAMAQRELDSIIGECAAHFEIDELVVEHRTGELTVGEASVVIAAAHPHRAQAFDAARYVIEEIKKRLPIWKMEQYITGDRAWVGASASATAITTTGRGA
jgi:molybdopterin synthase catalytic subunit